MGKQQRSKITERGNSIMTVQGVDTFFTPSRIANFDFSVKALPEIQLCPFWIRARCNNMVELTEPTARAFAKYILQQCDAVRRAKRADRRTNRKKT